MVWRDALRRLLSRRRKSELVEGYVLLIETMGDDEEERRQLAREILQLAKGEASDFDDAVMDELRKLKAYII